MSPTAATDNEVDATAAASPRSFTRRILKLFSISLRHQDQFKKYDAKFLKKDGFAELLGTTDSTCLFIEVVMLHLVDEDRNNQVTRQELLGLQTMADEWAIRKSSEKPPTSILEVRICVPGLSF